MNKGLIPSIRTQFETCPALEEIWLSVKKEFWSTDKESANIKEIDKKHCAKYINSKLNFYEATNN